MFSLANSVRVPRLSSLLKASTNLVNVETDQSITNLELKENLICDFLLSYFDENQEKVSEIGKSRVSGKQLLSNRNFKYVFLSS